MTLPDGSTSTSSGRMGFGFSVSLLEMTWKVIT